MLIWCALLLRGPALADEGMYPINVLEKLNLAELGFKVSLREIVDPDGVSLVDGIVNIGGCTGSFVSPQGLILTNHHCVFDAVRSASGGESDFLEHGFLAQTRDEELAASGLTVRITESYRDVSAEMLTGITEGMDPGERASVIDRRAKELVLEAEGRNPGKRAEVAEMFVGKSYALFLYTFLRDVRLVYVPPRGIGEFGGEADNWVWPRHTGDFSFVRAYVGPDGEPAPYSRENVPFHPKRHLRVQPEGVDENDFVFILGYPGRTFRHRSSHFLAYEHEVRIPMVVQWNDWQIRLMEEAGRNDRSVELKHIARIKSLGNILKNHRGKLVGIRRLSLVDRRRAEDVRLQAFIDADPARHEKYGTVLRQLAEVYDDIRRTSEEEFILDQFKASTTLLRTALVLHEHSLERSKPDIQRDAVYMDRNVGRTREDAVRRLRDLHIPTDFAITGALLGRALNLSTSSLPRAISSVLGRRTAEEFLSEAFSASKLSTADVVRDFMTRSSGEVENFNDPFIRLAVALRPLYDEIKEIRKRREGELNRLYGLLVDVKQEFLKEDFLPDANRTLRLTFGRIKGYSPADALYASPITTVDGLADKATGLQPFDAPAQLLDQIRARNFGRWEHRRLGSVPVGLLYNLDTTGGNSGSPLLNARGEIVGVNFDRAFEATINDYAWSPDYSRSIAVDIRFVLWVTEKFGGAVHVLEEMGVPLSN